MIKKKAPADGVDGAAAEASLARYNFSEEEEDLNKKKADLFGGLEVCDFVPLVFVKIQRREWKQQQTALTDSQKAAAKASLSGYSFSEEEEDQNNEIVVFDIKDLHLLISVKVLSKTKEGNPSSEQDLNILISVK